MKRKHRHKWETIRTIWPYMDGYGVWCPNCKTMIADGYPTLVDAEELRDELIAEQETWGFRIWRWWHERRWR